MFTIYLGSQNLFHLLPWNLNLRQKSGGTGRNAGIGSELASLLSPRTDKNAGKHKNLR